MAERLDPDKIETLRTWGGGLARVEGNEELAAAGRAILLLIDEIEHLTRDVWHARAGVSETLTAAIEDAAPVGNELPDVLPHEALLGRLMRRLRAHPRVR